MEGDALGHVATLYSLVFQSTPSAWRETLFHILQVSDASNFNPLPPHGGRQVQPLNAPPTAPFQSTPSAWRETCTISPYVRIAVFQSTPSAWRETAARRPHFPAPVYFNPLPPHGGRRFLPLKCRNALYFNPLPPHGGRRLRVRHGILTWHFNPLPPHGGRQLRGVITNVSR